jgi:hypothetical protein
VAKEHKTSGNHLAVFPECLFFGWVEGACLFLVSLTLYTNLPNLRFIQLCVAQYSLINFQLTLSPIFIFVPLAEIPVVQLAAVSYFKHLVLFELGRISCVFIRLIVFTFLCLYLKR